MNANYMHPVLRQLRDQQVRFAPRDQQMEQANRAERLLGEIDPARVYPYEYLCYRITDFRPTSFAQTKLSGEQASHDLRLFVEDLTDAASVKAESAGEEVLTVEELAQEIQCFDQDDFALAATGLGEPAVCVRRPQARGLFAELRGTICGCECGASAARGEFQPDDRSGTGRDYQPGAATGRGRRMPLGYCATDCAEDESERGNHSLHAEAVRSGASGPGDFSDQRGTADG